MAGGSGLWEWQVEVAGGSGEEEEVNVRCMLLMDNVLINYYASKTRYNVSLIY